MPPLACSLRTSDYVELFSAALADRVVRRPPRPGLRVRILGPLEARLTESDRVVLGGLVEGTWPPETRNDPWLSRPMRHDLGLDLPERRIGLSAHDFAQVLGAREVILTRAAKIAGTPDRALALSCSASPRVAGERWQAVARARQRSISHWARALDRPDEVAPAPRPAPKPPRAARPTRPFGHRDRGLAARPLHDLRQAHSAPAAARCGRCARPAPPSAAPSSTPPSANSPQRFADELPADPTERTASRSAKSISPRSTIFPRRAPSGGRASCASRAGSRAGSSSGAPASPRSARRDPRRDRHSARRRHFHAARHRRPHRAAQATAATPSSTTRPARRAPRSRCARAWRRSSRWKPRSCARAASRRSRLRLRWPSSPT